MIVAVGEALMEFRRARDDGVVDRPGRWDGPFPSGAPAIFASVAARLGGPAALVAAVGDDAFGRALARRLRDDGVAEDGLRLVPGRATAVAFVAYLPSGERDFWFSVHDSAALALDASGLERVVARAEWVHVSGSTLAFGGALAAGAEEAAERVVRAGGRLSVDPNLRPDASPEARGRTAALARRAHVLFPSEGELEALGLSEEELVVRGALVCHTRGPHGAVVAGREVGPEPVRVPAPRAEEVDPTGAGDTFAAAFACATRAGARPVAAARAACAVASRSVEVLGAMELRLGPGDLAWAEPEEGSAGPRRAQRPQRPSGPRRAQRPSGPGRAQGP